jgi:outer membrane protein insertion porin family/translocation and assembly module TamA
VRVEGLDRVEEEVVTRELAFERGEPYALEAQETTQDALFDLGLFRSVRITPDPPAEAEPDDGELEWPMVVTVEERKPRTLRIGVGYGTEERFRVRVEWRHRNFLGDARLLDVRAQYNALVSGLNARVTQPHFLLHDTRLEVEGYVRYETVPAYDALRASPGFMLYHDLDERWTLRTGYLFEFADVLEAHDVSELEGDTRIGTLRTGLRRSTLDDELEPTRGTWLDLSLEPSLRVLGSEESWLTLGGEVRGFLPLGIAVLALRLRAGVIDPIAGSDRIDVPVFKRFYSGGSTSVRGFPYQELGPEDASGDPLGGLSIAEGSFEVRFPLFWRLRGVGFVDAGLLDLAPYTLPLHDLRYSAGPGLRLQTAVGSIRLDVGFPLDREPGEDRFRIHLAVGHAF